MFKSSFKPFLRPSVFRKQFVPSTIPKILTNQAIRMSSSATPNELLNVNKLYDVSNYTAVVTGGGTGIGLMITQTLVANGAKVYITGRRGDALDKVVETYGKGAKGSIVALPPCDITNKDEIKSMVQEVEKNDKGIHLLVNNAGIAKDDTTKYSNGEPDFKVSKDRNRDGVEMIGIWISGTLTDKLSVRILNLGASLEVKPRRLGCNIYHQCHLPILRCSSLPTTSIQDSRHRKRIHTLNH
jgi:hypothetical protein